jgi:hypothetical protein
VTFGINFLLGSLAYITLPSVLLPGSGAFLACIRATAWGLLLAPTLQPLAYAMLPHSLTLLLEGEGYILAALFGLLIPVHILQSSLGGNPLTRFGRVVLLNLKAKFWIALVLAVAAIYEASGDLAEPLSPESRAGLERQIDSQCHMCSRTSTGFSDDRRPDEDS